MRLAVDEDDPVTTGDLWADPRWPDLTLAAMTQYAPELHLALRRIRGAAALPGGWLDHHPVLSCALARPVDSATVAALTCYERLVNAAWWSPPPARPRAWSRCWAYSSRAR